MALELAGLASGFDWRSFIDQITSVERAPQFRLRGEQNDLARVNNAYGSLKTNLSVLKNRVDNLADPAFFNSRLTRTSDETVGSATATSSTPNGQFSFDVTQLASSSSYAGSSDVGSGIHTSSDLSGITVAGANFSTDVTAGFFTVNGKQITVGTTDSISDVFARISTETGSAVTGSYDSSTDKFTLTSASEIVLGSATDSSNFLQVSKLYNTGTGSVSSTGKLGAINQSDLLTTSTAISDGGAGAGSFKINGVSIAFNATTDSVAALLSRISDSDAGVTASYDAENDRFNLANKNTGDVGIALEDVTGNFLAVSGLTGGTLSRGNNALYTINGGPSLVSASNTITDASSGISGLSVTALKVGSVDLNIESDKAKLKAEIKSFIGDYNRVQAQIDRDTASTTSADGKVAAGILQGQSDAQDISSTLRSTINAVVSGLSASLNQVADIGIVSNGNDNSISLSDEGSLVDRQDSLTEQTADIDEQIKTMERLVQANEQRLVDSFVSMEVAQANINQQLQFLSQRFGTSSSAAG
jgi:flagellar hook-associated protein 2